MPRSLLASAVLCLAACSSSESYSGSAFGDARGDSFRSPAGDVPFESGAAPTEAELRSRLAKDVDPTSAALMLVRRLDGEERQEEALFVLDAALRRLPGAPELTTARAAMLRDLGRRHEAVAVLEELVQRASPENTHPGLLYELAELHWLEGNRERARSVLQLLLEHHAEHDWTTRRGADVARLEEALREHDRPQRLRIRDLLGNLRGAPDAAERLRCFEELVALGGQAKARAEARMLDDPAPGNRARGVAQIPVQTAVLGEFCAAALADPDPLVRSAGASRAAKLPPTEAAALLLPMMAVETSTETFRAMHAVLQKISGVDIELSTEAAADPTRRAAVVGEWRKQWER